MCSIASNRFHASMRNLELRIAIWNGQFREAATTSMVVSWLVAIYGFHSNKCSCLYCCHDIQISDDCIPAKSRPIYNDRANKLDISNQISSIWLSLMPTCGTSSLKRALSSPSRDCPAELQGQRLWEMSCRYNRRSQTNAAVRYWSQYFALTFHS